MADFFYLARPQTGNRLRPPASADFDSTGTWERQQGKVASLTFKPALGGYNEAWNEGNATAMQAIRIHMQLVVLLGCLSSVAHAAPDCGPESNGVPNTSAAGQRHHPIGKPLPQRAEFNQPTNCGDRVWFFDLNHNGRPDAGEPRLFGPQRVIECSSCHADSPDAKTEAAASLFLRQDASVLCLVCHNL